MPQIPPTILPKDVLFAKQPIYDNQKNLFGYEILFRNKRENFAQIEDGSKATLELLINYCCGIFDGLSQPYVKIFINMTRELILSEIFLPLPPNNIVIEILEDCEVDEKLLNRIAALKEQGYIFAMDDISKIDSRFDSLVEYCNFLKFDLMQTEQDQLSQLVEEVTANPRVPTNIVFLAEKVETYRDFYLCKDAGFELFQGYFLSKPEMVYGKDIANSSVSSFNLLAVLQNKDVALTTISDLVSQDITLSYQLLKIMNSPLCRLPRTVNSIQEAVVYIGLNRLKQWVMILTLKSQLDAPVSVIRIILERAKFCELIANSRAIVDSDAAFAVGLFSGIDLVIKAEKDWLLDKIGLSEEIKKAITKKEGELGSILESVLKFNESQMSFAVDNSLPDFASYSIAQRESVRWTTEVLKGG